MAGRELAFWLDMSRVEPPARLCCSRVHAGPVCPDGMVMCCICYGRWEIDELHVDSTGTTWDMCRGCGQQIGEQE